MTLIDLYLPLKHSHLGLVALSIVFFMLRGSSRLLDLEWTNQKWVKIAPHIIDSFLMLSGVLLMFAIQQFPIAQSWLTVKLMVLIAYIFFGIKTMKSTQKMQQRSYFAAAILCVMFMITIAKTHNPLGLFSL